MIDHITRETSAEKNKDDTKIVGKTAARSVRRGDPATGGSSDATSLNKRVPQWGHTAYYYDDTIQEKGVDLWHLKMISYKPGKTMKDAENKYVAQPELGEGVDYYIFRENGASWDDENVKPPTSTCCKFTERLPRSLVLKRREAHEVTSG